jgi:ribose transport system substrate-binding protein
MLTRNPDLDGIYVAWATAAAGVLESLRTEGRTDTKIVTNDLEAPLAIDMCQGGNVVGVVANPAVLLGDRLAVVSAYGVLDKPAPELAVVPPLAVTSENVAEGWQTEFGEEPPAEVQEVCGIE